MGSLLGARLSQTGFVVSLLSSNRDHMDAVRRHGLIVEELDGTERRYDLPSYDAPGQIPDKADQVIVMVKSYSTEAALASVAGRYSSSAFFLTLQNGIGNWERIAALIGEGAVLSGVTAQGATLTGPGRIRHGGNGHTYIGEPRGAQSQRVLDEVELFRRAGFGADASDKMEQLIWEKLMVNVGINAITALTGIRNGVIAEIEAASRLCRAAVEEALLVARAKGFIMQEDMAERVLNVARATAVNRSSMGQDVDRRKRTEIDAINGSIVRFGKEVDIPTPVNRTLTQLIQTMEASYLGC